MIRLVEALNYRCLRYMRQPLGPFHVLVGPNASGKSTFLDALGFLQRLVSDGLDAAVGERTSNFHDLTWMRQGDRFELAVEALVPEERWPWTPMNCSGEGYGVRYEVAIGLTPVGGDLRILEEQLSLSEMYQIPTGLHPLFPPKTLFKIKPKSEGWLPLIRGVPGRGDYSLLPEVPMEEHAGDLDTPYLLGYRATGMATVLRTMVDVEEFPSGAWLENLLRNGVRRVDLQSASLRQPSPPGKGKTLLPSGSNLPWILSDFEKTAPERFADWIAHVRTALPDVETVRIVERPEDRHRYLMLRYRDGLEAPSWMLSDGTLRLLALTLLAYLPETDIVYLVEEPETSVHPLNIETITQSLNSMYGGQVLVATHSPTVLATVKAEDVLVFSRDKERGTRAIRGSDHPGLRDWQGEVSLGTLFAGGVFENG